MVASENTLDNIALGVKTFYMGIFFPLSYIPGFIGGALGYLIGLPFFWAYEAIFKKKNYQILKHSTQIGAYAVQCFCVLALIWVTCGAASYILFINSVLLAGFGVSAIVLIASIAIYLSLNLAAIFDLSKELPIGKQIAGLTHKLSITFAFIVPVSLSTLFIAQMYLSQMLPRTLSTFL